MDGQLPPTARLPWVRLYSGQASQDACCTAAVTQPPALHLAGFCGGAINGAMGRISGVGTGNQS